MFRYVKPGSEKEINISSAMRQAVLHDVEKTVAELAVVPPLDVAHSFDPAEREVRKLIRDGDHLRAFSKYAAQNIGTSERQRRFRISVISLTMSLALFVSLLFTVHDQIISRAARCSTFLLNIIFASYVLSAKMGV